LDLGSRGSESLAIDLHHLLGMLLRGGARVGKKASGFLDAFRMGEKILEEFGQGLGIGGRDQESSLPEAFAKGPDICCDGGDPELSCFVENEAVGLKAGGGKYRKIEIGPGDLLVFISPMKEDGQALGQGFEILAEFRSVDASEEVKLDGEFALCAFMQEAKGSEKIIDSFALCHHPPKAETEGAGFWGALFLGILFLERPVRETALVGQGEIGKSALVFVEAEAPQHKGGGCPSGHEDGPCHHELRARVLPKDFKPQLEFFFTLLTPAGNAVPAGSKRDLPFAVGIVWPQAEAGGAGGGKIMEGEDGRDPQAFGNLYEVVTEPDALVDVDEVGPVLFEKALEQCGALGAMGTVPKIAVGIRPMESERGEGEVTPFFQADALPGLETSVQEPCVFVHCPLCPAEGVHISLCASSRLGREAMHHVENPPGTICCDHGPRVSPWILSAQKNLEFVVAFLVLGGLFLLFLMVHDESQ